MKKALLLITACTSLLFAPLQAQETDQVIENIIKEANENSQLENLGHQLMDVIGPRLVGTPEMKQAHDWAVNTYEGWGISAKNEQWGEFAILKTPAVQ